MVEKQSPIGLFTRISEFGKRNVVFISSLLVIAIAIGAYFLFRSPKKSDMARYAPSVSLAYMEINSLPNLVKGLTQTQAWRDAGRILGLSSQLGQAGLYADLIGRTGAGPDEAVIIGRAQFAFVITHLQSETVMGPDGPSLHLKPGFAVIIDTHTSSESASRLSKQYSYPLARHFYGESTYEEKTDYNGVIVSSFIGPNPERRLVAASNGSLILIGNNLNSVMACIDTIQGRSSSLADNAILRDQRETIDKDGAIFVLITAGGLEKLAQSLPALSNRNAGKNQLQLSAMSGLLAHISKQNADGLLYSSQFSSDGITDRYLLILSSGVASELAEVMKPAPEAGFEILSVIPDSATDISLFKIENTGELPESLLKSVAPRLDIASALALREMILSFRSDLGIERHDSLREVIGNEIALVRFEDNQPLGIFVKANDKGAMNPFLERYLKIKGHTLSIDEYGGVEISISSNPDGRAAAYLGDLLLLGTRAQIVVTIDSWANGSVLGKDEKLKKALANRPPGCSVISFKRAERDTGETLLLIGRLTRVNDGSEELLDMENVKAALGRLPYSVSFTVFNSKGVLTESHSAMGNYGLIGSLINQKQSSK